MWFIPSWPEEREERNRNQLPNSRRQWSWFALGCCCYFRRWNSKAFARRAVNLHKNSCKSCLENTVTLHCGNPFAFLHVSIFSPALLDSFLCLYNLFQVFWSKKDCWMSPSNWSNLCMFVFPSFFLISSSSQAAQIRRPTFSILSPAWYTVQGSQLIKARMHIIKYCHLFRGSKGWKTYKHSWKKDIVYREMW